MIVGLGDSTTAGTPGFLSPREAPPAGAGDPQSQYAYWMMRAHPDWVVSNCGVNGQESREILERFPEDVLEARPEYVIILVGVNDIYRGRSVASVQANLRAMYSAASAAGIRVVAASVLPFNSMTSRQAEAIDELNAWIARAARESRLEFCDTHALAADPEQPRRLASSPDGYHPDVAGYRRMAEGLCLAIERAELRPRPSGPT
jgi:lysophospholipase L1-like esterase